MGALSLWEKLAPLPPDPGEDAHVALDAILPTRACAPLRAFYDSSPLYSDAEAESDWAYAAQRYLDSGQAAYGARVATCDPHAIELGAFGIAAFHHAPAALVTRGRERHQPVGQARRTLVRVNDALPPGCDAMDVGLHLGLEAGPAGFTGAVLSLEGPGVEALDLGERRRLLGASAITGCLTALGPLDEHARQAWWQLPVAHPPSPEEFVRLRPDEGAVHHELVVVNASDLKPLALDPLHGLVAPADAATLARMKRVAIGGCVGGDLDSLRDALETLEWLPPAAGSEVFLVPSSQEVYRRAQVASFDERARAVGASLVAPAGVPASLDASTTPCLGAPALVASPLTLIAGAHGPQERSS
jgi:homoaconitase/3-isopropylmalate dehydratase large subunit